jgi:hypothetical protein
MRLKIVLEGRDYGNYDYYGMRNLNRGGPVADGIPAVKTEEKKDLRLQLMWGTSL